MKNGSLVVLMKKVVVSVVLVFCSGFSFAAEPNCYEHAGGPYCSCTGSVQRLYLNDTGRILVYFGTNWMSQRRSRLVLM